MAELPNIALSVRQPWAWAIIHGGKDVENRSAVSISTGRMTAREICIHASLGMTQDEYGSASRFMESIGVDCPPPDQLIRGGIIGSVCVVGVVSESESDWFFGPRGLTLSNARPIRDAIPCIGELGYFRWKKHGVLAEPKLWMTGKPRATSAKKAKKAPLFDNRSAK